MKIGPLAEKPPGIEPVNGHDAAKTAAKPPATAGGAAPDASAQVQISSAAATLLAGGASAEFDADKVARIAQAITDGSFKPNPEAIADKLISNAQELLSKTQH